MHSETEQNTDMYSNFLAQGACLNGQMHAKMCQLRALRDYSRKPSLVME